jgi:phage terminase large subunit
MIEIDPIFARLFPELSGAPPIDKRYIIITGGRGSMKSFTVALWACWNTTFPGQRALYTRYTLSSAEISIIPEFQEKIELLGLAPIFRVKKSRVLNTQTGSDILFSGIKTSAGNQTAKLKSIPGLNVLIVDEAEEFTSEKDFDTIDESIRAKSANNRVILIMNPSVTSHWIYQRFFAGHERYEMIDGEKVTMTDHPDVFHIHTTYLDNKKNLSQSFLDQTAKLKVTFPKKYALRSLGAWQSAAEGAIYENWEEGVFDESLPAIFAFDEGYSPDPAAMGKIAVDVRAKRVYFRECFYKEKLSTGQVIEHIGQHAGKRDLIMADEKGRLIFEIGKAGYNIKRVLKYPGSVKDGILKLQDYRIIVDPASHNAKMELQNYVWNDKKSSTPVDAFNHLMDCLRYGFEVLAGTGHKKAGARRRN